MYEFMNMIQMIQYSMSVILKFFCLGLVSLTTQKSLITKQQCLHICHFQNDSHRLGKKYGDTHTVRG